MGYASAWLANGSVGSVGSSWLEYDVGFDGPDGAELYDEAEFEYCSCEGERVGG